MSPVPFTNLDAQYLFDLGETFLQDGDLEVGIRLRTIAEHLQRLDTRLMNLERDGGYAEGVHAAYTRVYGRSNLPDVVELEPDPGTLNGVPVRHIAPGRKAAHKEPTPRVPGLKIKLDLAALLKPRVQS